MKLCHLMAREASQAWSQARLAIVFALRRIPTKSAFAAVVRVIFTPVNADRRAGMSLLDTAISSVWRQRIRTALCRTHNCVNAIHWQGTFVARLVSLLIAMIQYPCKTGATSTLHIFAACAPPAVRTKALPVG